MTEAYDSWEHAGLVVEIVSDDLCGFGPQDNDNAGTLYSWTPAFLGDERIHEPDMEILCPTCQGEAYVPTRYWPGSKWDECPRCHNNGFLVVDYAAWFAEHYDAALTIPLFYSDGGSCGARIYECDDDNANCALVFTQEEIDKEWSGYAEAYPVPVWRSTRDEEGQWKSVLAGTGESGARPYAKARINELDQWLQGNVWGIVIRDVPECAACGAKLYVNPTGEIEPICFECGRVNEDKPGRVLHSIWGFIGEPDDKYIIDEAKGMAEAAREEIDEEAKEAAYWAARDVMTV